MKILVPTFQTSNMRQLCRFGWVPGVRHRHRRAGNIHRRAGNMEAAFLFAARLVKNIDVRRRPAANSNPQEDLFSYWASVFREDLFSYNSSLRSVGTARLRARTPVAPLAERAHRRAQRDSACGGKDKVEAMISIQRFECISRDSRNLSITWASLTLFLDEQIKLFPWSSSISLTFLLFLHFPRALFASARRWVALDHSELSPETRRKDQNDLE